MLSLAARLHGASHRQRLGRMAAAAAAVAVSSSALLRDEEDNGGDMSNSAYFTVEKQTIRKRLATAATTTFTEPHITQCDSSGGLLSTPPQFRSLRGLRRHATFQKLEEIATTEERLVDKYNVQLDGEPLGEGTFGAVYAATHKQTGEAVAVKKIHKRNTTSVAFQREMDALLLLRDNGGHPNICSMRENFDEDNSFYIVFDLVSGREMFEELCFDGPYSEADAARHIREATAGLAFMHGLGIIHADLKPENLMLSSKDKENSIVKLVDLGCAHLTKNAPWMDHLQKGTANTPAYCPPEVLRQMKTNKQRHAEITPSFDMWSLGVVLYVMLVGAHPFDLECNATDQDIERRILAGEKPPLRGSELTAHLSEDAISLIEGLMEWDPEKRWTAEQVLENRWVKGETASSKKIADSDKRLREYRKYQTKIGSAFFKALLSQTDAMNHKKSQEKVSVLESAFRRLDTESRGFLSAHELGGESSGTGEDALLSLSDVTSLLSESMKSRHFPQGHVIYHEGARGDSMYMVDSGTVEVTTKDGFRKKRGAGEIFGEEVLKADGACHSSTVRCETPVQVLEIPRDLFQKYVTSDEETLLSMAETERSRRRERASTMLRAKHEGSLHTFRKGKTIFREGQDGDFLFLVAEGDVDISVGGHKVRTLKVGEMTGEHAVYHGKPYNVTAQCASKCCKLQALPSKAMHRLFEADPSLHDDFRELLLRRDFKKALCAEIKTIFPTTDEEIRAAFDIIDADGSGAIDFEELRGIVMRFDPTYNLDDIRDMLASLDLNQSGSLTWKEFHRIFAMDKET